MNMGIWEYVNMKTTLEIPDALFRQAKVKAAMDGRKLKDLVAEGLTLVLTGPGQATGSVSTTGNSTEGQDRNQTTPSWYGALAPYARRARAGSDMGAIRKSIARGIVAERQS